MPVRSEVRKRILFDILFWIVLKGYELIVYSTSADVDYAINTSLNRFPAELVMYYGGLYYVFPKYLERKNTPALIFRTVLVLVIAILFYKISRFYLFPKTRIDDDNLFKYVFDWSFFSAPFYFLPIPALGFIIHIIRLLHANNLRRTELEKLSVISEINLLKSKIQPHFLFNTLNNLYSLSLSSSPKTPASILQLSGIMEYMLYETSKEKVSLQKELQYLESYIALEKLRYGNRLDLLYTVDKELYSLSIAPLILFPFIENAFKHGASREEESVWIQIELKRNENRLVYTVSNSKPITDKRENNDQGQGLKNLQQRLELSYPRQYELTYTEKDDSYTAMLKLGI